VSGSSRAVTGSVACVGRRTGEAADQAALARDGDLGLAVDQRQCALGQRRGRLVGA
jgi:hypothetical protein